MLPPRVKALIKSSGHLGHQAHIATVRANIASASNIVRHSAARQVDEMGPGTAAAIDKILRLP